MRASMPGVLLILCAALACQKPPPPEVIAPEPVAPTATTTSSAASTASATAGAAASLPLHVALSPEAARRLAKRAAACLDDPRCPPDEARRLYGEVVDTDAIDPNCFDFYYGIAVAPDAARARACFERKVVAEKPCNGASPSLERTFFGLMLLDAQGGPRERERGEALFAGCLTEGGIVIGTAERREKIVDAKPIDFCAEGLGTTQEMTDCALIDAQHARFEAQNAAKDLFVALAVDDAGFTLWSKARDAWSIFSSQDAAYAHDVWRGGTGAPTVYNLTLGEDERERPEALRALLDPPPSPDSSDEADGALKSGEGKAGATADTARRKILADAQAAWRAYRRAETAFVRHAFAIRYGSADAAARAAYAAITRRRAKVLDKTD